MSEDNASLGRIESEISSQSNKIEALANSISELAKILARKEERDHHTDIAISEVKTQIKLVEAKVSTLELISAGDDAMRKIFWRVTFIAIGVVVAAVLYTVVTK